jgi:O-6-methylguanine DNA methyltransferase
MKLDFLKSFPPEWRMQVHEYLAGKRTEFDVKPEPKGTDSQMTVWREIAKIPYGKTKTYTEIATAIGNPKAVRAVGTACGRNPYPIIIPCHRVLAAHGLGGYLYGLEMKKQLLELEQRNA